MSVISEFRKFALKGNLIDMAVAFVMGAAFGKIVSAFIDGMVMPVVGKIVSGVDFKSMKYILSEAKIDATGKTIAEEASIKYGEFITVFIDFTLVAFCMFLLIKALNRIRKKQEETKVPPLPPSEEQMLLREIRDLLKQR